MLRLNFNRLVLLFFCLSISLNALAQKKETRLFLVVNEIQKQQNDTLTFYSYKEIKEYLTQSTHTLYENGFISASYSLPIRQNDSVFTTLLKKNKKINFLEIDNWNILPNYIRKKFVTINLKAKNIFEFEKTKQLLKEINKQFSNNGDPFSSIELQNLTSKRDTLSATIFIEANQKRSIDSLVINGYKKFPIPFLKNYAGIKKGNLYKQQKLITQTQQLNTLAFTSVNRPAEVLFNPKKTIVYLYLDKVIANNFDGFLGFSTDEESGNLVLDGYLNLNLINNLNFGEEIALTYKSDSEEQRLFKINVKLPYLFKLPLSLEAGLEIFRQEDTFSSTEQKIGFSYAFSPSIESLLGYKKIESADLNENENLISINQNFDATFLNSETRFLIRQPSRLFPLKTQIIFNAEIGNRKQGNTNQLKVGLSAQQVFQLNKRNSIYLANNAQFFSSNNYLPNELYRLGGILSIRGFEENSLRASLFNVINTEYRFQLNENIYAHSIIDFAFIDNQAPRTSTSNEAVGSDNLTSFGLGFGMLTKAGLFKLNYANGISSDIPFKFDNSKVHISLTAYF